jgi:hypothetical protein
MPTAECEAICVNQEKQKNQYAIFEHFRGINKLGFLQIDPICRHPQQLWIGADCLLFEFVVSLRLNLSPLPRAF